MTNEQKKPRREFRDTTLGRFLIWLVNFTLTAGMLIAVALGLYNVLGPGDEILDLAKSRACQDEPAGCSAAWTMWERRPWVQALRMSTPEKAKQIECRREYILYGPWSCVWSDNPKVSPAPSGSAPDASSAPSAKGSAPFPVSTPKGNKPRVKSPEPAGVATTQNKTASTLPAVP